MQIYHSPFEGGPISLRLQNIVVPFDKRDFEVTFYGRSYNKLFANIIPILENLLSTNQKK